MNRVHAKPGILVLTLLLTSCATVVRAPLDVETVRFLPSGAAAYARLDRASLAETLAALPGLNPDSVRPLVDRTDSVTAAFVGPATAGGASGVVAVAEGRYPAGAASLRLASDPSWRRRGKVWEQGDGSLNLAFSDGGRAFFGTVPLDGVLAAAAAPNKDPIPARWAQAWTAAVAFYIPDPIGMLSGRIPMGDGAVPILAMVMTAEPSPEGYDATLYFEFATERSALVFSPLCRVFLYAVAHSMWPERAATVTDRAVWSTEGAVVQAADIPLDAASIAAFIGLAGR